MCRCWESVWDCKPWRWRTVQLCTMRHTRCTAIYLASPTTRTRCSRAFHQVSRISPVAKCLPTHMNNFMLCCCGGSLGSVIHSMYSSSDTCSCRSRFCGGAVSLTGSAHRGSTGMPGTNCLGPRCVTCGRAACREPDSGCSCKPAGGAQHPCPRQQRPARSDWHACCCGGGGARGAHGPCTQDPSPLCGGFAPLDDLLPHGINFIGHAHLRNCFMNSGTPDVPLVRYAGAVSPGECCDGVWHCSAAELPGPDTAAPCPATRTAAATEPSWCAAATWCPALSCGWCR
jgi:hypothetical protein